MGLFGKMFEKKSCAICGGEIGLLGNRKLEDGNMCKNCAAKLSPWFSDRRRSTVESIKEQLAYREDNKSAVAAFNTTLSYGEEMKVLIDEDAKKFMVTRANNIVEANPDVLDFSQVTGVDVNIEEDADEQQRKNKDGEYVSYNPPKFIYNYDVSVVIRVNHPYFDEIEIQLNPSSIRTNPDNPLPASSKPNPMECVEYKRYKRMGRLIKETLTNARQQARDDAAAANAPKVPVTCVRCGATTIPDDRGCCEYCGCLATE